MKETGINIIVTHRKALVAKISPAGETLLLADVVHMVNFIKTRSLKSFISHLYVKKREHKASLPHMEAHWLWHDKGLACVYELQEELQVFFNDERYDDAELHAGDV